MREVESMHGGLGAEEEAGPGAGSLVVLNERLGNIAKATVWLCGQLEGQKLIVVPHLRVEHIPAMMIAGGAGLVTVFNNIKLKSSEWEEPSGFIGGTWRMWRTASPELWRAGFVVGQPKFDIEKAVRGVTRLINICGMVPGGIEPP